MKKFRHKPVIVSAEQYIVGHVPAGANVTYPEIIFSKDGKLFYPSHTKCTDWLSIEKNKDGKYDSIPFAFYEIRSGERKPITEHEDLLKIYQQCFNLKTPKEFVWIEISKDRKMVNEYEWVVQNLNGTYSIYKPEEFENNFEIVE